MSSDLKGQNIEIKSLYKGPFFLTAFRPNSWFMAFKIKMTKDLFRPIFWIRRTISWLETASKIPILVNQDAGMNGLCLRSSLIN